MILCCLKELKSNLFYTAVAMLVRRSGSVMQVAEGGSEWSMTQLLKPQIESENRLLVKISNTALQRPATAETKSQRTWASSSQIKNRLSDKKRPSTAPPAIDYSINLSLIPYEEEASILQAGWIYDDYDINGVPICKENRTRIYASLVKPKRVKFQSVKLGSPIFLRSEKHSPDTSLFLSSQPLAGKTYRKRSRRKPQTVVPKKGKKLLPRRHLSSNIIPLLSNPVGDKPPLPKRTLTSICNSAAFIPKIK